MKRILLPIIALLGLSSSRMSAQEPLKLLEAKDFSTAIERDSMAVVLDVRKPSEYQAGHIAHSMNINFLDTPLFLSEIKKLDKKHIYYIYCRSGRRSAAAAEQMRNIGLLVVDLKGGILQWKKAGLALAK